MAYRFSISDNLFSFLAFLRFLLLVTLHYVAESIIWTRGKYSQRMSESE